MIDHKFLKKPKKVTVPGRECFWVNEDQLIATIITLTQKQLHLNQVYKDHNVAPNRALKSRMNTKKKKFLAAFENKNLLFLLKKKLPALETLVKTVSVWRTSLSS